MTDDLRSEIAELFASFDQVERFDRSAYHFSRPAIRREPVTGSCNSCHRRPAKPNRKCCAECIRRVTAYNAGPGLLAHRGRVNRRKALLRARAADDGVCTRCLRMPSRAGKTNCAVCAARQAELYRLRTGVS